MNRESVWTNVWPTEQEPFQASSGAIAKVLTSAPHVCLRDPFSPLMINRNVVQCLSFWLPRKNWNRVQHLIDMEFMSRE